MEKETPALIWALHHFEVYSGSGSVPLVVYTDQLQDHNARRLSNSTNRKLMRWVLFLQSYCLIIRHIKG